MYFFHFQFIQILCKNCKRVYTQYSAVLYLTKTIFTVTFPNSELLMCMGNLMSACSNISRDMFYCHNLLFDPAAAAAAIYYFDGVFPIKMKPKQRLEKCCVSNCTNRTVRVFKFPRDQGLYFISSIIHCVQNF